MREREPKDMARRILHQGAAAVTFAQNGDFYAAARVLEALSKQTKRHAQRLNTATPVIPVRDIHESLSD